MNKKVLSIQGYDKVYNGITSLTISLGVTTRSHLANFYQFYSFVSSLEPLKIEQALGDLD
jgi:hypothetical protein